MLNVRAFVGRVLRVSLWEHGGLTAVLLTSLGIRLWLLRWWDTFPFGDVFNFVSIARALGEWDYPIHEKRLPFYPLLIFLVHTVLPAVRWETIAIGIAVAMSLVALALLYAVGRTLHLQKTPLLVAVLLVASFQPFLAYSIRGYADTTFLALFLGSLLAVLRARTLRGRVLIGVLLGLLALTRYEGVVAGLVLFVLLAFRERAQLARLLPVSAALVLTLLPYVILALHVGRSLLPEAYLTEAASAEEGYGAATFAEFAERYAGIWRRLGLFEVWRTPLGLLRSAREDFLGLHRPLTDLLREPRSAAALLAIPGFLFLFSRRRLLDVATVLLPFFAVAAAIAWYATYVRYHAFLFPLMALAAGAGVHAASAILRRGTVGPSGTGLRRGLGIAAVLFAGLVWFLGFTQETQESLRKSRFRGLGYYRAFQYAETLPGIVAFENRLGITEAYFGERAVYAPELFPPEAGDRDRGEALRARGVAVVVAQPSLHRSALAFLSRPPADITVEELARFAIEQGNHDVDVAVVYRVHFPP